MRYLLIALLLLILNACAAKKLAVDNADTLLEYQVEKTLPLYSGQKKILGKEIDKYLLDKKGIAQEMLPVIDQINLDKPDELDAHYLKLTGFYKRLSYDFSKILARHIAELDNKQRKDFFENIKEETKKIKERTQEEKREKLEDQLEKLFGPLTAGQKLFLKDHQNYFDENLKSRLERREKLYSSFKGILDSNSSTETKQKEILNSFENHLDASAWGASHLSVAKKFVLTLKPAQKETFREKTIEIKEILNFFIQAEY